MTASFDRLAPLLAAELSRQFDIVRPLGRGGMGVVWLARERSLDRLVAIKALSGEAIDDPELRERFRREARIAARLVHPNIVPLYAFGETADALYFVLGYVEGETLAARLDREGRLGRDATRRILSEIADALAFAHHEGVVHRDVKPENILLDARSGRAMLADFGVAGFADGRTSVTRTGIAVGTPSYMSPEQAAGARNIDGRSDIYSLGVVGYRMLAGDLPFTGADVRELLAKHAVARPDDLVFAVRPEARFIAGVIMRALEKDPAARWANAGDFRSELLESAADDPALPAELARIQSSGTLMVLLLMATSEALYVSALATNNPTLMGWKALPFATAIVAVLGATGVLVLTRSVRSAVRAFGWGDAVRALFQPPSGWSSWWPAAFRRPDDVWHRLPAVFGRVGRFSAAMAVAFWAVAGVIGPWTFTDAALPYSGRIAALMFTFGAVAFLTLALLYRAMRNELLARGLSKEDATQFIFSQLMRPSSHPGWKKPRFAALLAPPREASGSLEPRTPADLVSAIVALNERLRRAGLLADSDCANAAKSVKAAIDGLDAEVRRLHRDLDPDDGERLERRLASLEPGHDDDDLRRLLETQRAVVQRLEQRQREKECGETVFAINS